MNASELLLKCEKKGEYPLRITTLLILSVISCLIVVFNSAQAQSFGAVGFSVSPATFRAGQQGNAILSISSLSASTPTLTTGDKFNFTFDSAVGNVSALPPQVSVESASLAAGDFSVSPGPAPNQVVLTYTGQPKSFPYGNIVSFEIGFTAAAQVGSGRVTFSSRFTSSVNGNFPYSEITVTDFGGALVHDATLTGAGVSGSPLGIAPGGVNTTQLADGAVTAAKIANGAVGAAQLADSSVTETKIVPGAVGTPELATGAVTSSKIPSGTVVRSLNGLTDSVSLQAGNNVTITPSGNTLTIAAVNGIVAFNASSLGSDISSPGITLSKSVPAGTYLVLFKVHDLVDFDGDSQTVTCTMTNSAGILPASDEIRLSSSASTVTNHSLFPGALSLQSVVTFSATETISVNCVGFRVTAGPLILTAVKIGSLQ